MKILGVNSNYQLHLDSVARKANAENELDAYSSLIMKHVTDEQGSDLHSSLERQLKQTLLQPLASALGNGSMGQGYFPEVLGCRLNYRLTLTPTRPSERLLKSVRAVETPPFRRQCVIDHPLANSCMSNGDVNTSLLLGKCGTFFFSISS